MALRRCIAVAVAIVVTVATVGLVRVDGTGGLGAAQGGDDPDQPSVTRALGPDDETPS